MENLKLVKKLKTAVCVGFLSLSIPALSYAKDIVIIEKDQKYFYNKKEVTGTTLEASVGDTLKLVNQDPLEHCVMVTLGGKTLNSNPQKPKTKGGKDIIIPLTEAGTFKLKCNIHPTMILDINVK